MVVRNLVRAVGRWEPVLEVRTLGSNEAWARLAVGSGRRRGACDGAQ